MSRIMNTASNTLSQLQKQMDIISNNMANVDTTGLNEVNPALLIYLFNN